MQLYCTKHHHSRSVFHRASLSCSSLLLILFLASCGQPARGIGSSGGTLTSPTVVSGKPVTLQSIRMFDANTGWAVTSDGKRLLHTTHGALHWQDVTPAFGSPTSINGSTNFLDAETAWVVGNDSTNLVVYRTSDSGVNWQKAQVPDQSRGKSQITFLNTQVGWLVVGKGAGAGSEAVDVLHTSDGGATWKVISVASYTTVNQPGTLPFEGDKTGISFVNASTGWMTGFTNREHFAWLYMTHDGGATWQPQAIPLPASASQVSLFPPVFFNASDGIMPVEVPGPQTGQTTNIYVTHDGGTSWHTTSAVPVSLVSTNIVFVDATHGWIADNHEGIANNTYINSTLYSTSDGGQHWTQHTIKLGADITMLTFVSHT
ncbi:MAG: hypothetical protein ABI234_15345, partial [Ktedonobacteraceae bacterium]